MKKAAKILAGLLLLTGLVYVLFCTSLLFFPDRVKCMSGGLVTTKWKQMGGFQKYTPDSLRTGCWSTALAQIAYYHRLRPFGHVAYTSRNSYQIDEQLDSAQFDFAQFSPGIDSMTSPEAINQMAKYNYYAALIVRKDFGTDRYMNKLAPCSSFGAKLKCNCLQVYIMAQNGA